MKKIFILVCFIVCCNQIYAQDPIFTQYFMVPETINSSFAGSKENTKLGLIHRTQWPSGDLTINTEFAYADNWFEEINSGLGVSILKQTETTSAIYNFTQVNFNYVLKIELSNDWYFRPSISIGYGNKDFGFQNVLFGDQINAITGSITPTLDPIQLNNKISFFDFSSSLLFNNERSWVGITLKHLNKPNISMAYKENNNLAMFFSVHSLIEFPLNTFYGRYENEDSVYLMSNFMKQGDYNRFDIGPQYVMGDFSLCFLTATNPIGKASNKQFITSINFFAGFKYEGFKFGASMDYNTSKIGRNGGIYELSILYEFNKNENCTSCPKYY